MLPKTGGFSFSAREKVIREFTFPQRIFYIKVREIII
jgi:hypothetical protein